MRTRFETPIEDSAEIMASLKSAGVSRCGPAWTCGGRTARAGRMVLVSKYDHCLVDLLYRLRTGELSIDIPVVVSNHPDLEETVARHGIPFEYLPVTPTTEAEADRRLLDLVAEHEIDLVVLARYMRILSEEVCTELDGRAINIHHSFLPGFKGAKPYHQAWERGVKLIGATAHYVTADLDEGPIIDQDVARVTHSQDPAEMLIIGRDLERLVLSRAVKAHAEGQGVPPRPPDRCLQLTRSQGC